MRILKDTFLSDRLFWVLGGLVFLFILGYYYLLVFAVAKIAAVLLGVLILVDLALLFRVRRGIFARRETPEKLSNGDENRVSVYLENLYTFPVNATLIDEIPVQFQKRDFHYRVKVPSGKTSVLEYLLRPVERGEYKFGALNIYVETPLGFLQRRFRVSQDVNVPVYPSFIQMRKYELLAISNRLTEAGIKKVRRLGHSLEFDQIRHYVLGDDLRTINWKATARHRDLMVNQYQEERSQQVYSVIDMGRVMKMPFEGMTLLDYAINASLVLSNIALYKQDKAGLITFSHILGSLVPAERRHTQMPRILDVLYKQQTGFLESDYEKLYATIQQKVRQRSLILLFTNFATLASMRRQMRFLRGIARQHLLVTIFFENTELHSLLESVPEKVSEIYTKTVAEKFAFEKKEIVKELGMHGIHAILTQPAHLTVNTINKYLELKSRGFI